LSLVAWLHRERLALLILSAVLIGLVPLTRYAGVAMLAAGALSVLLLSSGRAWARFKKALLFGLLASLPVLVWLVWTWFSSAHSLGGRSIGLTGKDLAAQFQAFRGLFIDTIGRWVPFANKAGLTYRWRFFLAAAGLAGLLALSAWAILRLRNHLRSADNRFDLPIFSYFGLSAFFFVAVLLLTYLFSRPTIDIDNRMLLPLFVCSVMTLYGAFALWETAWSRESSLALLKSAFSKGWKSALWQRTRSNGWKIAFQVLAWLVAAVCLVWYVPQARAMAAFYHKGDGLTAYHWGRSRIIQAVSALPADQPVISNDWQLLLLWTGRPIYGIWVSFPKTPPMQTTPYGTLQADPAQAVFCTKGAALVVFNDFRSQFPAKLGKISDQQKQDLLKGLSVYGRYPDGVIYLCP
jgi:hypothetical protein